MKITQIICQVLRIPATDKKTASLQEVVLVRVRTKSGLEGIGEANASPEVVKAIVDAPASNDLASGLREVLIGENVIETERLWQKMYRSTRSFGRTSVTIAAMSAVDIALWDLKGKHFSEPIHRLLGGKQREQIRICATTSFGRDGEETRVIGRRFIRGGYRALKFCEGGLGQHEGLDLELVRGARRGAGDNVPLLVNAGGIWDARTALRRAQAFAKFNLELLEEPLRPDDVQGYAWLRDRAPMPIAAGQNECGREAFRALIDRRAVDVYQVDLSRNGFTDAAFIKARVEEAGGRLGNHCHNSPITVAAAVHWLSTCRNPMLFEEAVDDSPLRTDLALDRLQAENGWMTVPDKPGLGITLNEAFIDKYLVAESGR
jgi:L-rhamnonate dehydratase